MVIAVKAGVKHLQDKLDGLREELGGRQIQLTDETTARVMTENEKVMLELMARIRVATDDGFVGKCLGGTRGISVLKKDEENLLQTRPYNQRIDLPLLDEDWDDDDALKDNDVFNGELED